VTYDDADGDDCYNGAVDGSRRSRRRRRRSDTKGMDFE